MQAMINESQQFASRMNLKFGTNIVPDKSKTKCVMFARNKRDRTDAKQLTLDGYTLPWVSRVKHLGHTLQTENTMNIDISMKRGSFIGKINSIFQEFHYAAPDVLIKLISPYACNIYGSNLWDLFSPDCQKLFNSYNVMVRNVFKLPRKIHRYRYLSETLTDIPHLFVQLLARYVIFVKSMLSNDAFEVRFLANLALNDKTTVVGRSVGRLLELCNHHVIETLSARLVKENIRYMRIPDTEQWRIGILENMRCVLEGRNSDLNLTMDEAKDILDFVCTT